jgi:hypothetical protein
VLGRGAVADHRFRAACEDRRHQASLMGQIRTAHSEDPTMKPVQAATCNAMLDPVTSYVVFEQLVPGDHPMLPARQPPKRRPVGI